MYEKSASSQAIDHMKQAHTILSLIGGDAAPCSDTVESLVEQATIWVERAISTLEADEYVSMPTPEELYDELMTADGLTASEVFGLDGAPESDQPQTAFNTGFPMDPSQMSPQELQFYLSWMQQMAAASAMGQPAVQQVPGYPPYPMQQPRVYDPVSGMPSSPPAPLQAYAQPSPEDLMAAAAIEAEQARLEERERRAERQAQELRRREDELAARAAEEARIQQDQMKAVRENQIRQRNAEIAKRQVEAARNEGKKAVVLPSKSEVSALRAQQQMKRETVEVSGGNSDFDINHVPFTVSEFEIADTGLTSSMYVECVRKDIGEWDVPMLLSENALDVREFTIYGRLMDGLSADISWSDDQSRVIASVSSAHKVGPIAETKIRRTGNANGIESVQMRGSIVDKATAYSASEALSFLPEMEVEYIKLDIEHDELGFQLWFMDADADIEVEWIQDDTVVREDLQRLLSTLSVCMGIYATEVEPGTRRHKRDVKTKAGHWHENPEAYNVVQARALEAGKMTMNLKSISIDESGRMNTVGYQAVG